MKNKNKILILIIAVFILFASVDVAIVLAADIRDLTLNVPIGKLTKLDSPIVAPCTDNPENDCTHIPWIAQYVSAIYYYGLRLGAMFAVLMIIIGGMLYLTAGANPGNVSKAKGYITSSLFGLIILFGSYLILYQVNPELTKLPSIEVEVVKRQEIIVGKSKFCENLDPARFTVKGYDAASAECGDVYDIDYNAQAVQRGVQVNVLQTTCISNKCKLTTEACDLNNGKYDCVFAYVYGDIIESYASAYLDYVRLYANKIGSIDPRMGLARFYSEKSNYSIGQADIAPEWSSSAKFDAETYYLGIEVNDPTALATIDDNYAVDRSGNPIGIDGSICCTYSCGGNGRLVITEGCNLINKSDFLGATKQTVNIDIDTGKFFCGDKPMVDVVDDQGHRYSDDNCYVGKATKVVGDTCSKDSDCNSKNCVAGEHGEADGTVVITKLCSCDDNNDCPFGKLCVDTGVWGICSNTSKKTAGGACTSDDECISNDCYTAVGVCECNEGDGSCDEGWVCKEQSGMQNICIPGNEIGESCTESWECLTDNCVDGTCRCDDDEQCPANQRCVQDSTLGGLCVELRPYGEICEEDNQCVSQVCRRDPELGKKICNCNGDNDCPSGKSCQFVPALPLPIKQCR